MCGEQEIIHGNQDVFLGAFHCRQSPFGNVCVLRIKAITNRYGNMGEI